MGRRFGPAVGAVVTAIILLSFWLFWEPAPPVQAQGGSGPDGHTYLLFEEAPLDCDYADPGDAVGATAAAYESGPLNTMAKLWLCVYDTTTFNFRGESETAGKSFVWGEVELYDRSSGELLDDWSDARPYGFCGQCPYHISEPTECIEMSCCGDKTITLEPGSYRFEASATAGIDVSGSCDEENYSTSFVQIVAPEEPEEPEPITYTCESLGGIELVSETVRMDASDRWRGWISDTGWSRLFALITMDRDGDLAGYAVGDVNGESRSLHLPSGPDMEPQSFAVPDARGGVDGPEADVEVVAQSDGINLLSVCVLPTDDIDYCPNGVEALQPAERPLDMAPLNGHWEGTAEITATQIAIKYVMGRSEWGSLWGDDGIDRIQVEQQLCVNSICYLMDNEIYGEEIITYTLPDDGVIAHPFSGDEDPYVELAVDNRKDAIRMYSICVMDANAVYSSPVTVTPEECRLLNPDFSEPIGHPNWTPSDMAYAPGAIEWNSSGGYGSSAGVLFLRYGYGVRQEVQHYKSQSYDIEIRARQAGGENLLVYGTPLVIRTGSQWYTATVAPGYSLYRNKAFFHSGTEVEVYGADVEIDYVCLRDPSGLIDDPGVCDPPVFDSPEMNMRSDDPLQIILSVLEYLWLLLRAVGTLIKTGMEWMICEIQAMLARSINPIYDAIYNLVISWPVFPDPDDGLVSWLEWAAEAIYTVLDWLGINGRVFGEWFPYAGESIAEWFLRLFTEILYWIFDQLGWGTGLLDDARLILEELLLFIDAIFEELNYETGQLMALLRDTGNVLLIPLTGFRQALTGSTTADIGIGAGGYAGYIWQGMQYMNERIQNTPLPALNVLALGVITLGLVQWTLKRYLSVLS